MPGKKNTQKTEEKSKLEIVPEPKKEISVVTDETPVKEDSGLRFEDLKVAYIVGLTPDDNFVFELFGQKPGLVELLGIHHHACKRVDRIYDDKQISGDRLIHEVGKAISTINQKLDQVLQVIAPKVPDNKLD